jgi:hypothetical protein
MFVWWRTAIAPARQKAVSLVRVDLGISRLSHP